jgi:hypothetical protein
MLQQRKITFDTKAANKDYALPLLRVNSGICFMLRSSNCHFRLGNANEHTVSVIHDSRPPKIELHLHPGYSSETHGCSQSRILRVAITRIRPIRPPRTGRRAVNDKRKAGATSVGVGVAL